MEHLKQLIRNIPDFPVEGILFRDITTLLKEADALSEVMEVMVERYRGERIDLVAGIESRGFILGAGLAIELKAGFIPIRKPGKLPAEIIYQEYELEYGKNRLELHRDAVRPGQRVLVHDDLLATGGTAKAGIDLIEELGGEVVGAAFVAELTDLPGRENLQGYDVFTLLKF